MVKQLAVYDTLTKRLQGLDPAKATGVPIPAFRSGLVLPRAGTIPGEAFINQNTGTASVWDGNTWEVVWTDSNTSISEHHSIDVTGYAVGNESFRIRLNYQNAADDKWFSVDNVSLIVDAYNPCSTSTGPPPGSSKTVVGDGVAAQPGTERSVRLTCR